MRWINSPWTPRCSKLDGTETKSKLGANAILAVSLATARLPLARSANRCSNTSAGPNAKVLPVPMANVINGGAHSDAPFDFREFMVQPHGFNTFSEGLQAITEIFHALKSVLKKRDLSTAVGDEGGFAPKLNSVEDAIESILEATKNAGYKAGKQIYLALDVAASEFYNHDGTHLQEEHRQDHFRRTARGLLRETRRQLSDRQHRRRLCRRRLEALKQLTDKIGDKVQLVGDDLFVTNVKFLQKGIDTGTANSILVKVNQIGSLTETSTPFRSPRTAATPPSSRIAPAKPKTRPSPISPSRRTAVRSRPVHSAAPIVWRSMQSTPPHRTVARQERRVCRFDRAEEEQVSLLQNSKPKS